MVAVVLAVGQRGALHPLASRRESQGAAAPHHPPRKKNAPRRGITKQHKHGPPSSLDCSMRQQNYEFADTKHSRIWAPLCIIGSRPCGLSLQHQSCSPVPRFTTVIALQAIVQVFVLCLCSKTSVGHSPAFVRGGNACTLWQVSKIPRCHKYKR